MPDSPVRSKLGTEPVPGPAPAGASVRYDLEFEKVSAEIAKLESVTARNDIRWGDVVTLSTSILTTKSKDLLVAAYLSMGWLQRKGYPGLADGLTVCRDLLATWWDSLFPEAQRIRARQGALQWLADRVGQAVAERPEAGRSDREILTACAALLGELGTLASEKFGELAPDLGPITRAVQEKLDAIPVPAAAASSEGPVEGAPPAQKEISTPDSAREALAEMRERQVKAATVLREAAPNDPFPYRVLRRAVWEDVAETPPAENGKTGVPGGDAALPEQLEERLSRHDYAGVLAEAETRLVIDRFWLDLNFYVARAMEGLGRGYDAARKAVGDELAALVRRLPGLLDLRFESEIPFAGEAARLWILNELGALPGKAAAGTAPDPREACLSEARKLVARKRLAEATALVQKELQSMQHRRDRFLCRLTLAKLCLEAGKPDLALPQLEALDEEARKFAVEEWEPALSIDLVRELWKCHKALPNPEKASECYSRLCRLDLSAALALNGKK